uniref:Uncharacterized protein n=1 Tax=Leptobrachium leishanense TaxID=445787 RepID=A0A8C5LZD5_9ANUR
MAAGRQMVRYHKVQEAETEETEELTIYLSGISSQNVVRAHYRGTCLRICSSVLLLAVAVVFVLYELQYGSLDSASARPPGSLERSWNSSLWADTPPSSWHGEKSTGSHDHKESEEHESHDDLQDPEHHSHQHDEESDVSHPTHSHDAGTYHNAAVLSDSGGIFSSIFYDAEQEKAFALNALPRQSFSAQYGIPHLLQGLRKLHQKHGRSSWSHLVDSSVRLAKEGFQVDKVLAAALKAEEQKVMSSVGLCNQFCESDNAVKGAGAIVRNPTLGNVLQQVATSMADSTLPSDVIQNLLKDITGTAKETFSNELSKVDLREEEPITLHFADLMLYSTPWPSAGKILTDSLQETYRAMPVLEEPHTASSIHKAYQVLLNATLATYVKNGVGPRDTNAVILSGPVSTQGPAPVGSTLLVADKNRNIFVMCLSLNSPFGSGYVSPSTGILLSDFAYDTSPPSPMFWATPSVLLGMEDPTIMMLGSTGGSSVPFSTAQVILNHLTLEKDLQESVRVPLVNLSNDSPVSWREYLNLLTREPKNAECPASALAIEVEAEHVHVAKSPGSCCFSDGL